MADLAQNPIGQYSRSNIDKLYADSRESLFGHLVVERGRSVKTALEELRPHVKTALKSTEAAASWCQKLGISGVGLGILVGASMGIGYAALPLLAGCLSLKLYADSRDEMPRREAEFHLLRECSNLPEALYALHLRGVNTSVLVGSYDSLINAVEARLERGAEFTEAEVGQFLEAKITALGTIAPVTNQTQQGIERSNDQGNDQGALSTGNPIESQPIALGESIAVAVESIAAPPSYGVSRVLTPLDILIKARFSHRAFYGGQRTGKSYLTAVASQELSKTGIKVFHMNLFSHGPEDSKYWGHVTRSIQCDLSILSPGEAVPYIRQAQSILTEFKQTTGALLIIDEITSLGNLRSEHLEKLQPFINGLVSYINAIRDSSKKRQKAVWTIAPGIVSAGLDQGVKELIKGLSPVLVSIPKDVSIEWEGQALTTDLNVYGQLKVNYQGISEPPAMDCDRMVLIDNVWLDMGELPKLITASPSPAPIAIPPNAPSPSAPSLSSEERKAEIARMKANIERLQELNEASHDERIQAGIDYEMHDSFDPPRDRLERLWEAAPAETDPAIELINEEQNPSKREALTIAYQWAISRQGKGETIDRQTFLERARKDRNCEYLRDNRDEIWHCLEALIN